MSTPIERLSDLVVGTVESVAPNEIKVVLEADAPQTTALNTGTPAAFPRLNGYVLLPHEAGATVGYIGWIGIERSPYPKQSGLKDFGLVDLPFPLRKMTVLPVGTLTARRDQQKGGVVYELARGVVAFPSVGDQVLIPTPEQVQAIVGSNEPDRRIQIGTSPMAADAAIRVDPDKLFGRHLAVLGNTGSGKSCTVAGLIRWSLAAAQDNLTAGQTPNARFLVLDPNGEYARAFKDLEGAVRVYKPGDATNPLKLPAWMWNSHEWSAVTNAQPGAQRPLLMQALRNLRAGQAIAEPLHVSVIRQIRQYRMRTSAYMADGSGVSYTDYGQRVSCCNLYESLTEVFQEFANRFSSNDLAKTTLDALVQAGHDFVAKHRKPSGKPSPLYYYDAPNVARFGLFLPLFDAVESALPSVIEYHQINEDAPIEFDVNLMADCVDKLSADSTSNANIANFIATLTLRIRSMLSDQRLSSVVAPSGPVSFESWLEDIVGSDNASNGQVAVIDLSLVPSDVTHLIIAVMARLVFESLQRYRKKSDGGKALPLVMVLEEAHTFVRKGKDDDANVVSTAQLCREAFERIAREGRKFGLGLVLSSQRPSELSPTVLAQCNTFILHRIVNDADQDLVARLVPDNVSGLLKELPSLPSRQAIMLGWATPIPVLVEMGELSRDQRPESSDPDFWDVWTHSSPRTIDWNGVAADWRGTQ